jgi:hypothetical protein
MPAGARVGDLALGPLKKLICIGFLHLIAPKLEIKKGRAIPTSIRRTGQCQYILGQWPIWLDGSRCEKILGGILSAFVVAHDVKGDLLAFP